MLCFFPFFLISVIPLTPCFTFSVSLQLPLHRGPGVIVQMLAERSVSSCEKPFWWHVLLCPPAAVPPCPMAFASGCCLMTWVCFPHYLENVSIPAQFRRRRWGRCWPLLWLLAAVGRTFADCLRVGDSGAMRFRFKF